MVLEIKYKIVVTVRKDTHNKSLAVSPSLPDQPTRLCPSPPYTPLTRYAHTKLVQFADTVYLTNPYMTQRRPPLTRCVHTLFNFYNSRSLTAKTVITNPYLTLKTQRLGRHTMYDHICTNC